MSATMLTTKNNAGVGIQFHGPQLSLLSVHCTSARVVQPDAVCEVGGSTPGLSHGDLGIFLGGGQTEEFVH